MYMYKMRKTEEDFLEKKIPHMGNGVVVAIDPNASSFDPLRELEGSLQVLGQDSCCQAIAGCICSLNSL